MKQTLALLPLLALLVVPDAFAQRPTPATRPLGLRCYTAAERAALSGLQAADAGVICDADDRSRLLQWDGDSWEPIGAPPDQADVEALGFYTETEADNLLAAKQDALTASTDAERLAGDQTLTGPTLSSSQTLPEANLGLLSVVDASGGAVTITTPSAVTYDRRGFALEASGGTVTVTGVSGGDVTIPHGDRATFREADGSAAWLLIPSESGSSVDLETDVIAGTNVTIDDGGDGTITINATASGGSVVTFTATDNATACGLTEGQLYRASADSALFSRHGDNLLGSPASTVYASLDCTAPSAATLSNPTTGDGTLAFDIAYPSEGETATNVYCGTATEPTTLIEQVATPASYTWNAAVNDVVNYCRVTLEDAEGNVSAYSNEVSATPAAPAGPAMLALSSPVDDDLDGTCDDGTLGTWIAANDAYLVTWYDQMGTAQNATQATAADQALLIDNGTLLTTASGLVAPFFVAGGANHYDLVTGLQEQPTEMFAQVEYDDVSGSGYVSGGGSSASLVGQNAGKWRMTAGTLLEEAIGTATVGEHTLDWLYNGASSLARVDGAQVLSGDAGSTALSGLGLGANTTGQSGIVGHIAAWVLYSDAQAVNRAAIESALGSGGSLDGYTASGNNLYATWKALSAYSGPAMRLRRGSDSDEADVCYE